MSLLILVVDDEPDCYFASSSGVTSVQAGSRWSLRNPVRTHFSTCFKASEALTSILPLGADAH